MIKSKKIISVILIAVLLVISISTISNASASSKVFGNSQSGYASDCVGYAIYGYNLLGYSVTGSSGQITTSDMLAWIGNTGNGYGMYVHTYGGDGYFNDYYGYSIVDTDISGNWDFVYIDSSYSAASNTLASAFNTIGYTNRCFLGWSNAVTISNACFFNYYLWTCYIGNTTVQSAAVSAASCVPGTGTTPIALYGSTSYYGTAR
ncbi:MAG: hypothetical protein IKG42_02980 [Clostridia bacterium]|nr:hypothetical protein [Clostridia bacterium]